MFDPEIARLQKEVRDLRGDKKRLDWLQKFVDFYGNGKRVTHMRIAFPADGSTVLIREAVDAAMRLELK